MVSFDCRALRFDSIVGIENVADAKNLIGSFVIRIILFGKGTELMLKPLRHLKYRVE